MYYSNYRAHIGEGISLLRRAEIHFRHQEHGGIETIQGVSFQINALFQSHVTILPGLHLQGQGERLVHRLC